MKSRIVIFEILYSLIIVGLLILPLMISYLMLFFYSFLAIAFLLGILTTLYWAFGFPIIVLCIESLFDKLKGVKRKEV